MSPNDFPVAQVTWINNMATIKVDYNKLFKHNKEPLATELAFYDRPKMSYRQMHERLFHANPNRVLLAYSKTGITISSHEAYNYVCNACNLGKATQLISHIFSIFAQRPLALIYFDTIFYEQGYDFKKHTVHYMDSYLAFHWIGHTNNKTSETVGQKAITIVKRFERQIDEQIQEIQLNNGTEFPKLVKYAGRRGIICRPTAAGHDEMISREKHAGGRITQASRCAILATKLPNYLWPFAESAAIHVQNLLPIKANPGNISFYQRLV
jgi:hypothetical protein